MTLQDVAVLAAAAEANSEHPLGAAIVRFAQGFMELAQQAQQAQQGGEQPGTGGSSSSSGNEWLAAGGVLPSCRDVQVAVGQGISAWVQLPAGGGGGSGDGDGGGSWAALLALQAQAGAAPASAGAPAAVMDGSAATAPDGAAPKREPSAQDLAAAASAAQPPPQQQQQRREGEVWVAVGSARLMRQAGLALAPQAEAYMQEQEVGRPGAALVNRSVPAAAAQRFPALPRTCCLLCVQGSQHPPGMLVCTPPAVRPPGPWPQPSQRRGTPSLARWSCRAWAAPACWRLWGAPSWAPLPFRTRSSPRPGAWCRRCTAWACTACC